MTSVNVRFDEAMIFVAVLCFVESPLHVRYPFVVCQQKAIILNSVLLKDLHQMISII